MKQDNRVRQEQSCSVWEKADQGLFPGSRVQVDSKDVDRFSKEASEARYQVESMEIIMDLSSIVSEEMIKSLFKIRRNPRTRTTPTLT